MTIRPLLPAIALAAATGIITPAMAQINPITRPQGPVSPGVVSPRVLRPSIDLGPPAAAPMSPLYALQDTREIETNRRVLAFKRDTYFSITKPGDPVVVEYLTREKPTYPKVALLMTANTSSIALGAVCGGLDSATAVARVDGTLSPTVADDEVAAAAAKADIAPAGDGPLYRVRVTAPANDAVAAAAAAGRKVAVRAFPLDASGTCLTRSAGAVVAQLSKPDPNFDPFKEYKEKQAAYEKSKVPYVAPSTEIVGYYAPIDRDQCAYIIDKEVTDPQFREVLKFWKISTAVGTRFKLCEGDITVARNNMADSTQAKIFFENLLASFASAFNWTAGAFQSVAAAIAEPLGGSKYAQAFVQAMMGQLPGSPLTGNMDMVVDQGCGQLKQLVAAKVGTAIDKYAAENQKTLSNEAKQQSDALVQKTCDEVKKAMREKGRPADFLVRDLDFAERAPIVFVRVRYSAMDGTPPEGTLSEERTRKIVVHADNGISSLAPNGVGFQFDVMTGTLIAPPGRVGDSFIAPVTMKLEKGGIEPIKWSALITENDGLDVYDTYGYQPKKLHLIGWLNNIEPPSQ